MEYIKFQHCSESYLNDIFLVLKRAFPAGLERNYYDTLCLFIKPAFGDRVFAEFVNKCLQVDTASAYNDSLRFEAYIQQSVEFPDSITAETIQFVYKRLLTAGYKAWQASCFEKSDIQDIENIVSKFLPDNA